jgi:hypothetical protein
MTVAGVVRVAGGARGGRGSVVTVVGAVVVSQEAS